MTKIYESYSAFLARDNKADNGVSPDFAKQNPNFEKQNKTNSGCYDCSDCSRCSRCSDCSDCSRCSRCYECYDCSRCSDCYGCSRETGNSPKGAFSVPRVAGIHAAVLEAVSKPDALDMSDWHTCETTHCRAGWVVTLAGEAGRALEKQTSTLFAAMQIYKASSPAIRVAPGRYFEGNEEALADIRRCATEEATAAPAPTTQE
jgi:hypothetical protein